LAAAAVAVAAACGTSPSPDTRPPSSSPTVTSTPTSQPSTPLPTKASMTSTPSASPTSPKPTTTKPPEPTLPAALAGHVITRIPTSSKVIALTFDGGANADGADAILSALSARHVPASFFLTGDFVRHYPRLAARLASYGRVGDHSVNHPHMSGLSDSAVRAQVLDARAIIASTTGHDPRPWFRFPFGEYDGRTLRDVNAVGFAAVGWTVDSRGWMGTQQAGTASDVADRVIAARAPGVIVLMHLGSNPNDHSTLDADALPAIIAGLRAAGYSFVTLDALLG
jgi:peptidoglycan/xylan/chitin deacetylase (PgdA/CDA1 family)